jgi:tRNA pseudouridine55 synthase
MDGILLIDKPKDWTSHDIVAKTRNILKKETGQKVKVGHTGTLDPMATGLMIIVVGSYTKRAQEFSKLDKTYEVSMKLGETSTTGDEEGVKHTVSSIQPAENEINAVLNQFVGEIEQVPPIYSAIKVEGKRAYKLAREGKEVRLEPRKTKIYSLTLSVYNYPLAHFTAKVSSGTYIRSLVEDIGKSLGIGAYMTDLRRTSVGPFKIPDAASIQENLVKKIHLA